MNVSRRQFIQGSAAVAACTGGGDASAAFGPRPPKQISPDAVGMLYDSTLCVGCRACVAACKRANDRPPEHPEDLKNWNPGLWDAARDLSGGTLCVIRAHRQGNSAVKDRATDGYAFVKRHCLHCVDPSCVSVCPVSAMQKDPTTGIVTHDPDACIGCRYCIYACPFGVPQYEFDDALGEITKCQFCAHLQKAGRLPACCDVCPTGASLFGRVTELQAEAERRIAATPGEPYEFPRGELGGDRPPHVAPMARYEPHVYGVTEVGGTQIRYIAGVAHEKLGLPSLPGTAWVALAEGIQHTVYRGMIAPLVMLGALLWLAHRATRRSPKEGDE